MRKRSMLGGAATLLAVGAGAVLLGCSSTGAPPSENPGDDAGSGADQSSSGGPDSSVVDPGSDASGGDSGPTGRPPPRDGGGATDGTAPTGDATTGPPCAASCSGVCDQGTCKTCTATAGCSANTPVCDTDANRGLGQCVQVRLLAIELPDAQMTDRAHAAYQRHANDWFPQQAQQLGFFTFEASNDWDQLKTIQPQKGLIVMFVDISPSDAAQQAGFQSYVEHGGAWFGCHFAAYNDDSPGMWTWRWYFDDFLGGGLFVRNSWEPVSVTLDVDAPSHPVSQGLGASFMTAPSEWYQWTVDLRTLPNIQILLSIDPSSFPVGTDPTQSFTSGYYPIAWTNTNYKMMYINAGHEQMDYSTDTPLSNTFTSPTQNQMYINALKWLGGAQSM
jgi:hypothetical protein